MVGLSAAFAAGEGSDREGLLGARSFTRFEGSTLPAGLLLRTNGLYTFSFFPLRRLCGGNRLHRIARCLHTFINSSSPMLSEQNPILEPLSSPEDDHFPLLSPMSCWDVMVGDCRQ